jgi:transcriptional regulator GlxA family with amidase domain
MIKATNESGVVNIGFLLVPGFSMLAYTSCIEPLVMANRLSPTPLYRWQTIGHGNDAVTSAGGVPIIPDVSLTDSRRFDAVFVCAGSEVQYHTQIEHIRWLQIMAQQKMVVGAVGTGTHLLARAGLLAGCRCTIHWENIASLRDQFPELIVTAKLFEVENRRYTCAGGSAALDMFLHEIGNAHGSELASAIAEHLVCDRIREKHDGQRALLTRRIGNSQPKLAEVVTLMEANIEEPMTLGELSLYSGLSRRQLERLFQKHLQCVPSRFYLELRLERARQLLHQTSKPVIDVARASGFVSAPHFSKCYRDTFGRPPSGDRNHAIAGLESPLASRQLPSLAGRSVCHGAVAAVE